MIRIIGMAQKAIGAPGSSPTAAGTRNAGLGGVAEGVRDQD